VLVVEAVRVEIYCHCRLDLEGNDVAFKCDRRGRH